MSIFFAYLAALFSHWLALMSAGPFLIDRLITWLWPTGRRWLDNRLPVTRRRLSYAIIFAAVFFAGFSAWLDEHKSREEAEKRAIAAEATRHSPLQLSRIEISTIAISPKIPYDNPPEYEIKITYTNKGSIAAETPIVLFNIKLSDKVLSLIEIDGFMTDLTDSVSKTVLRRGGNQIQPGEVLALTLGQKPFTEKERRDVGNETAKAYAFIILKYSDDELPEGKVRITEFCNNLAITFEILRTCFAHNRIYIADQK
jgi:hypothetical protein